jgi:hypothetical protein
MVMIGLLAGCGAAPSGEDAVVTSREFFDAVAADDLVGACELLAPATRESLEEETGAPCVEALGEGETGLALRSVAVAVQDTSAPSVTVAGRQAQVVAGDHVTFLAVSGDSWLITAAACAPRPDRPYDCELEGD